MTTQANFFGHKKRQLKKWRHVTTKFFSESFIPIFSVLKEFASKVLNINIESVYEAQFVLENMTNQAS